MTGNCHVPCGAGEKPEITSNAYLLLTLVQEPIIYLLLHLMRVIAQMSRMNLTETNKKVMYEPSLFCYVIRTNYLPATASFNCFPGLNAGTFPAAI
jgi:hypothetical protein